MTPPSGSYPAGLEAEVAIRDGSLAHVRPVRPEDAQPLLAFLRALPDEDRRLRFFSLGNDLTQTARDETNVDYVTSLGLLASVGPDERVVGHALYAPCGEGQAEVAFAVAHAYQGRGLATILLRQLAEAAAAQGIETFTAIVLPENRSMLEVFHNSGFPLVTRFESGTIEVTFPTSLTPEALARFERAHAGKGHAHVPHVDCPTGRI